MEEILLLISLLKEELLAIEKEYQDISLDDSVLEDKKEIITRLRKDKNSLISIDLVDIEKILNELEITEKEEILRYFEIIQILLRLNKEKKTTYKLTESQLEYINIFLRKIDAYEKSRKKKYEKMERRKDSYQRLLDKLLIGKEEVTELDTLKSLFKDLSIREDVQSKILVGLLKYNRDVFQSSDELLPDWEIL